MFLPPKVLDMLHCSSFSVLDLLDLSNYFKYGSYFLTNSDVTYPTVSIWKCIPVQQNQYTNTEYYLYSIFANTGGEIILKIQQI